MDIIDQIKKLAGGAADKVLEKYETKRIGAEAERRGLFEGYLRSVPNETLADLLRERKALCASLTDEELVKAFAKRGLHDQASYSAGFSSAKGEASEALGHERMRTVDRLVDISRTPILCVADAVKALITDIMEGNLADDA